MYYLVVWNVGKDEIVISCKLCWFFQLVVIGLELFYFGMVYEIGFEVWIEYFEFCFFDFFEYGIFFYLFCDWLLMKLYCY